ncbi:MAG: hypothetical protein HY724_06235 [Candidatus Rokubacteria bacterium]|nr:hypothetical protein [Candidatus Rokubacteria bacterium]
MRRKSAWATPRATPALLTCSPPCPPPGCPLIPLSPGRPAPGWSLKAVRHRLPGLPALDDKPRVLDQVDLALPVSADHLVVETRWRILGRFGAEAAPMVAASALGELAQIPGTRTLWAELRWAARVEGVVHLDDLLLRRVRLGLLLPEGGRELLPEIRSICQPELGWDDPRWEAEADSYREIWRTCYSLPGPPVMSSAAHSRAAVGSGA